MQYCHECGFAFLGGLVDDWPSYLSRDGVRPSRFGNKVLKDYLYQVACSLSIHLESKPHPAVLQGDPGTFFMDQLNSAGQHPCISEAEFPPLGLHIFISSHAASGPCTAPAPVWIASTAPFQRNTNQPTRTLQGADFSLAGGVRICCKGSKAWWTWDSLPSPIFHGTCVPSRGNVEGRLDEPMIPGRGASTTCVRRIRRATQKHGSAPVVCSSVGEGEASA
ncbi:hypothetical protein HPB49_008519 [Dermacentor silvarum]|nr:hypothetical protein HPB49_008519 [Dermacentor silvarum]